MANESQRPDLDLGGLMVARAVDILRREIDRRFALRNKLKTPKEKDEYFETNIAPLIEELNRYYESENQ